MSQTVFGAQATVTFLNRAFNNTAPGNLIFQNQVGAAGTTRESQEAFARTFGDGFASLSDAALSERVLTNMGVLPSEDTALLALQADLAAYFGANAPTDRGLIVLQLSEIMANLTNATGAQAVYAPIAAAWNNEITKSFEYSVVTSNTATADPLDVPPVDPNPIQNYTLTTAQDILSGTEGANTIRGVAGAAIGTQDQTTLNSSDIIDGKGGEDTLAVLLNGNYGGGATIKNVETLQIGTNNAAAVQFDYNVNNVTGNYEVTGVNTVVYDQITVGETLNVINITPSATGTTIPTLKWANEAGSLAGTAGATYRQASVAGTADNQNVILENVNNGTLNIAAGVETLTITSQGSAARNTLLNSTNTDVAGTGSVNNVAADLISNGSLTKVVLNATTELGKVGGRVAATGLTDRVATDGVGDGLTTTAANLLSVGARVATVDAAASTAAVNVQFVAKVDGAATNVTFAGGAGNDYAEFEIGNVNATGGEGNDVFAFITQRNGVTNSTFGAGDTIVGGAGTDTIQVGSNGVGTYTISDSEWANKTGVDVVDLRGATNTVTLSSSFVAAADTGVKLTVTTDSMVVGGTAPSNAEYNSVNTVDLRLLNAGQGINFVGGQGSDRLMLNDSTFTSNMTLAGGSNVNAAGTAIAGDYDTLTVVNSAVLDRTDLANVSGFEGLVLSKTVTGAVTNVIELTEAFLLANTTATNSGTTTIDDRVFQIGTAAAANGTALTAGDAVRIDVTDLFTVNNNTVKAAVVGRQLDVTTLTNAGVTVQYVYNGTTYANLAALAAAVPTVGGNAVLTGADAAGQTGVVGSAGGLVTPNTGITFTSNAVGAQASVLGTNFDDTFTLTQADTVTAGTGADTVNLNAGSAAAVVTLGTGADTINVNTAIAATAAPVVVTAVASTVNITVDQGAAADLTQEITGAFAHTYNVSAAQTGLTVLNTAGATINASAGGVFTLGAAGQIFVGSGAAVATVNTGAGSDTVTLNGTGNDIVIASAGADTIALNSGADQVQFGLVATVVNHQISGFTLGTGGDSLRFTDAAFSTPVAGVATLTFASGTAAVVGAQALDATNVTVAVITGQAYANYAAVEAAMNAAGRTEADGQIVVFFNQTTNTAQVVYDTTAAAGGDTVAATLVGLTLGDLANVTAANFAIV